MRNSNFRKGKGKKTFSLIVDGETEIWYFQMMKRNEDLPKIDIVPELPRRKKLEEQFQIVLDKSKDYTKVFWVLDIDAIIKENRERKKGEKSKLQEFKEFYDKLEHVDNVKVLLNIPCFEYWFLLHFAKTSKYFNSYETLVKELKKHKPLENYEKTEKFYKRYNNDIYKVLKPYRATAITNAEHLDDFDIDEPEKGMAEIYKLFKEI